MSVSQSEFQYILNSFTQAVEQGDGTSLAKLFAVEGSYEDGFYGIFEGREAIKQMLEEHFWGHAEGFEWKMIDPVITNDIGYVSYLFSYLSKLPGVEGNRVIFEGMAKFEFTESKIQRYSEIFNTGTALIQLEFAPGRICRHLEKKVDELTKKIAKI